MANQALMDAVQRRVLAILAEDQHSYTRGDLIIRLRENHPPNEQWPVEMENVGENDLDQFLQPRQNEIVRFRDAVNTRVGNPFLYTLRRPEDPVDTFDHIYRRDADGQLHT